ncbi:Uma2 family endonuclease [Streptomyces sp. SCA3-4]|uniref:Uma2 family endonuclease n=1 Tax=Streptomyces sichuanensis TaxID=2871810 RepID=UPI001CE295B9|nr:Uma2 family endonuclease [Streptomyces sichuanensis]MCA6094606.1 Uma2 family endonuclease [Streptomyces sichuanensis]
MLQEQVKRATAETVWTPPGADGWTFEQVKGLELPVVWELWNGWVQPCGRTDAWHNLVRSNLRDRLDAAGQGTCCAITGVPVVIEEDLVVKPDVVVVDAGEADAAYVPVERVKLAVEVVMMPASRSLDRFLKPAVFAEARLRNFWRVERLEDSSPEVHEYWLHRDTGAYVSACERPRHRGRLETDRPFPVNIDLASLVRL